MLVIDDRRTGDLRTPHGSSWRLVTDQVMGGVSEGSLSVEVLDGRPCVRLRGVVSLDNGGGFVQAALDLNRAAGVDFTRYAGLLLEVYGNGEAYNVHLRTDALTLPWQSYRTSFQAPARWQSLRLPFSRFEPYRVRIALDPGRLQRIGLVAIGRAFSAGLCVAHVALYGEQDDQAP